MRATLSSLDLSNPSAKNIAPPCQGVLLIMRTFALGATL